MDGEGSVSLLQRGKRRDGKEFWSLAIQVTGKSKIVIYWLKQIFGGEVYVENHKNRKSIYYKWMIMGSKAVDFLVIVTPHLKLKKAQALLALKFRKTVLPSTGSRGLRTEKIYQEQKSYVEEIKRLNRED